MAYKTKDGAEIPSQFDLLVMPLLEGFAAITDSAAVAALREKIRETNVPVETDEFAHLRLAGTHHTLGKFIQYLSGRACPEFITLLEQLREGVARRHDALPANPKFPRAKLAKSSAAKASWVEAALTTTSWRHNEEAPVRNADQTETMAKYEELLG